MVKRINKSLSLRKNNKAKEKQKLFHSLKYSSVVVFQRAIASVILLF